MERMWFLVFSVKQIPSGELFEITQQLFLSVTGVCMNLSPFGITPTWSSVNGVFVRFVRYFSFVSLSLAVRLCAVFNLRCFRLLLFV